MAKSPGDSAVVSGAIVFFKVGEPRVGARGLAAVERLGEIDLHDLERLSYGFGGNEVTRAPPPREGGLRVLERWVSIGYENA